MRRESRPGCEHDRSQHVEQRLQLRGCGPSIRSTARPHPVEQNMHTVSSAPSRTQKLRRKPDSPARASYLRSQVVQGQEDVTKESAGRSS